MPLKRKEYTPVEQKAPEIGEALSVLINQRLTESQVILEGTWHFYFGRESVGSPGHDSSRLYLAVECGWRFTKGDAIIIGSEDFDVLERNAERQMDTLRSLAGVEGLLIESVVGDVFGGFRIGFAGEYALDVFPASDSNMEWLFRNSSSCSLCLMNGILHKSDKNMEESAEGEI